MQQIYEVLLGPCIFSMYGPGIIQNTHKMYAPPPPLFFLPQWCIVRNVKLYEKI
jgi:hypothetical protein